MLCSPVTRQQHGDAEGATAGADMAQKLRVRQAMSTLNGAGPVPAAGLYEAEVYANGDQMALALGLRLCMLAQTWHASTDCAQPCRASLGDAFVCSRSLKL